MTDTFHSQKQGPNKLRPDVLVRKQLHPGRHDGGVQRPENRRRACLPGDVRPGHHSGGRRANDSTERYGLARFPNRSLPVCRLAVRTPHCLPIGRACTVLSLTLVTVQTDYPSLLTRPSFNTRPTNGLTLFWHTERLKREKRKLHPGRTRFAETRGFGGRNEGAVHRAVAGGKRLPKGNAASPSRSRFPTQTGGRGEKRREDGDGFGRRRRGVIRFGEVDAEEERPEYLTPQHFTQGGTAASRISRRRPRRVRRCPRGYEEQEQNGLQNPWCCGEKKRRPKPFSRVRRRARVKRLAAVLPTRRRHRRVRRSRADAPTGGPVFGGQGVC